jgi:hypothetical protein
MQEGSLVASVKAVHNIAFKMKSGLQVSHFNAPLTAQYQHPAEHVMGHPAAFVADGT